MAQTGPVRGSSLVFPVALILIGIIFLIANWSPNFDAVQILHTYWPLILIFLGLGKIYDNTRPVQDPQAPRNSSTGSIVGLLIFVLVIVAIFGHGRSRGFHRFHGHDSDDEHYFSDKQHRTNSIDKGNARSVRAEINMGAGELHLGGGSDHLLDATFDFRNTTEPVVQYDVENGEGKLDISQEGSTGFFGRTDNIWNLKLSNEVPLTMEVNVGAGEGNIQLANLNVSKFEVNIGAGRANVDLTGDRKSDLDAQVNGGVGAADIRLPKNVGVIVSATGVIGSIDTHGLKHEGGQYTNDAYGKSPNTIHLTVNGAIGRINLQQE